MILNRAHECTNNDRTVSGAFRLNFTEAGQAARSILFKWGLLLCGLLIVGSSYAQKTKDTARTVPLIRIALSGQLPGGDMAKRFGFSTTAGTDFVMKLRNQWMVGAGGAYIFGNQIKEDGILDSLMTSSGFIINQNGNPSEARLFQRGFHVAVMAGRLFPMKGLNRNSGVYVMAGPQFLMHKIKIDDVGRQSPQLVDPYPKGYDRLTAGFGIQEFIGFMFLSTRKTVNFYGGLEFIQAFTRSQRSFDYDLMKADTENRIDLLFGFRIGWMIPFYRRTKPDFYYY